MKGRRKKAEANSAAWKASKEKVPYHKFAKERDPQQSNGQNSGEKPVWHSEDMALKTAAQYFGAELMPLLSIPGTVEYIAPTETVKLEARHFIRISTMRQMKKAGYISNLKAIISQMKT